MTFEEESIRRVLVKKNEQLYGTIELKTDEKSFTSYGSKKFLESEIGEIKTFLEENEVV